VTAIHLQIGNVAEYLLDPRFASTKLRPHRDLSDIQSSYQALLVALLTGAKVPPLIGDFTHLLLKDQHFPTTKQIFNDFQSDLNLFSNTVETLNANRRFPTNAINPKFMSTSVSI